MICDSIVEPITRRVEQENKSLDDIAQEICPKVKYGKEKIKRIIKDFLGEEYLIQHAETLKYDVAKADLAKKRKHRAHEKLDAGADAVVESASVTPIASCQTTQPVNTEHVGEAGQAKGQEQEKVLEVQPAACCQERSSKPVRKKRDSEEETTGEEHDDAPLINVPDILVKALRELIRLFSIKDVHAALVLAENDL